MAYHSEGIEATTRGYDNALVQQGMPVAPSSSSCGLLCGRSDIRVDSYSAFTRQNPKYVWYDVEREIIVATTEIINGDSMIRQFLV